MEKKSSTYPPVGISPSGCCEKLFHAFHVQPTFRRLPFRQHDQVVTPSPPAPAHPTPQKPAPQKQEIPATLLPVQSMLRDEQPHQRLPPPPQQKENQQNPSKVPSKVEKVASAKEPQAPPPPPLPTAAATKVEPARKSIEGTKTRKGFNQKVDDYINRTKNRMKSIGSNVGRTTTKIKE